MGFVSFNETYYRQRLEELEKKTLAPEDIYKAQQLLKVLDDLTDEGYTNLNTRMEEDFSCLTRLRELLKKAGSLPIPIWHNELACTDYSKEEFELEKLLDGLIADAGNCEGTSDNSFLHSISEYCEWIGYEEDTAYVFLLRDTLLPYVYYKSRGRQNIYPWLISRKFLENITEEECVDDEIRLPIYDGMEKGHTEFEDICDYYKKNMAEVWEEYSELKELFLKLLGSIKEKRIIIVESGYVGTIPMMLKSLDDRVSFHLYTTAPYLYETYKNQIFCRRYEDVRKFETVYSQDLLLRYSSYRDGCFYVNMAEDEHVRQRSLEEIKLFLPQT